MGIEDHVALLLHAGSVPVTIEANWLAPQASEVHGHYRMRVTGTRGTAEVDWAFQRLTVTTHDRATWEPPLPAAPRPAQYFFDALIGGSSTGDHHRREPAGDRGGAECAGER